MYMKGLENNYMITSDELLNSVTNSNVLYELLRGNQEDWRNHRCLHRSDRTVWDIEAFYGDGESMDTGISEICQWSVL